MERFWMVLADNRRETNVRHKSYAEAVKEAERLAGINDGVKFFVLESVSYSVLNRVQTTTLPQAGSEVPF